MIAIYKKELRAYFNSIIGYLFISFFLFFIGLYFYINNVYSGYANFSYSLYGIRFFFTLLIPMITMRIMAEENRQKTDQLLLTSPVSIERIIFGKYAAVLTIFAIVMVISGVYPLVLSKYGDVNLVSSYVAILAFFFLGAAYLAIGLFISAMTESQALAAIITFAVVLITTLSSTLGQVLPTDNFTAVKVFLLLVLLLAIITYVLMHNITFTILIGLLGAGGVIGLYLIKPSIYDGSGVKFFDWLTISTRFDSFVFEVFDLSSIVYYLSIIGIFVFLTIQVIKKRRWS